MKKLFFLIFLLFPSLIFAQSTGSLNISSENGDQFYVFLDGKKQNNIPYSNIRIQGLPDLYYSAKIIFKDSSIASISKNNLYVSDGDDIMRDAYYKIRRENAGKPKLSFYSMLTAQENFVPVEGMYVFKFGMPSVYDTMLVAEKKEVPANTSVSKILGSLNVFSQNGDKFFLFLDGIKQNDIAQSNIRVRDIPDLYYNVKIVFKDTKIAPIIKNNLFISDGDDNLMDATYRMRRDKTGKPRLNFYSMKEAQPDFIAPAGMYVYDFGKPASGIASATVKKTTPLITNIKITDPASVKKPTSKPVSSITATTKLAEKPKSITTSTVAKEKPVIAVTTPGNENNTIPENKKCNGWPMGKGDLMAAKKIIEQTTDEEEKLQSAQQIIVSNCLLSSQVTEFCALFKSEKSKLAFAKYAYRYTIDRKNYAEVNKALSLEKSKKELNKFISGG